MEYITVGKIVNTHGLKGELKILPHTHFADERFAAKAILYVLIDGNMQQLIVKTAREHKGMLLVCFEGFDDINQVEHWKNCYLYIEENQQAQLDEDEIYYRELLKMQVETCEGNVLGNVVEILETGANVVIRVKGEKELLIPYVKRFIKEVDKEDNILKVELLDGML